MVHTQVSRSSTCRHQVLALLREFCREVGLVNCIYSLISRYFAPSLPEKVKVKVAQSCPILCDPINYTVHGLLQARIMEWVTFPFSGDLPNPGIEPRSPVLQAVSLPAEPPGKPKNIGVASLSLLQGIFPTQESNWGLLHCRRILYQLSYQGSPLHELRSSPVCSGPSLHSF